ncbi:MAG: M48 family metalloprotease [Proteobacteria bacterium]|nr:M48 family metalloprotease [Pseudomonadota bacterium]MBU1420482.1 M48 family metalloprotease [Pseudomonadota bacterium]MBU1456045.1 M48 family metalloprotease [Pseudomonadota bacterium]
MLRYFYKTFVCFLTVITIFVSTVSKSAALTVGEERELGEQLLFQIRLAFPLLDDPDIFQYINELGQEVLTVAGVQYFDYHFYIVNSTQFNAFAAPSGLVFFYSGLIEQMKQEDELVAVLAHEIGHVVSRHIAKGMDQGTKVGIATTILALAGLALGAGAISQAIFTGSLAAGQAASLSFSREHEEEADILAYGWMKKMGRNPEAEEDMLRTMRRITRYSMGNIPQYLLTHPNPEFRLDYVQSLLALDDKELSTFKKTDNFSFLRMKYRILSQISDGKKFRNFLLNKLSDQSASEEEKTMLQYGLSQLDRMENNFDSSRNYLRKVIAHYPERSILLVDLGLLEMEDGNKEQALELIRTAYDRDPNDMWATFQLARINLELGNVGIAEKYLLEVEEIMPLYSKVYFELGRLKAAKGDNGTASYYLGKYYLYEGRLKLAKQTVQVALKDPGLNADLRQDGELMQELIEKLEKKE